MKKPNSRNISFYKILSKNITSFTIILFFFYFVTGCITSKKRYSFKIDSLQTYGDNSENLMSLIADYKYRNGKVYILDVVQKKIFIYKINGELVKQIQLRSGRGPGDFSMGLFAFDVITDTTLAILDNMLKRVQFISTNYNYLSSFYVKFMPNDIFYRDSLLYIPGNDFSSIISVYNLKGVKVDSLIKPFILKDLPQPWFSNVDIENDLSIYITNPYKTEIVKWQSNNKKWSFSNEKLDLISSPVVRSKNGRISMRNADKSWAGIFVYKNYLVVSTYNYKSKEMGEVKPKILIFDKNKGKLLLTKDIKIPFLADSFEKGKFVFMESDYPYPHLERININIIKR